MFERYTEKARRVIFFARYEASQYGSKSIDTEHILLALLREDPALIHRFRLGLPPEIRVEVEKIIHRAERISASVEMPLSADSHKILQFAAEEADRLADQRIDTQHILLGILSVEKSLAARLLQAKGAQADAIRVQMAQTAAFRTESTRPPSASSVAHYDMSSAILKKGDPRQLSHFFDHQGQFIDASGNRWAGRPEIEKQAETLLAPFAKKNASFRREETIAGPSHTLIGSVLWEFAAASGDRSTSILRMSIVLVLTEEEWAIILVQLTPVAVC